MVENDKMWGYDFEKSKSLKSGSLLLSEPFMLDENFRRTVVLVCEHNEENGTVGLIVNKPINLRLNDVVEDFPAFNGKVFLGGPVGTDTLQFLHNLGDKISGSVKLTDNANSPALSAKVSGALKLTDNLYWGGNFEEIKALIQNGEVGENDIRFYLGYSGWSVGQLEQELKDNSWIITEATSEHIFKIPTDALWKEVMKNMGGVYDTMAGYPESPTLN
jgi:putative transcriptional regulator